MADRLTKEQRSWNMSRIKGKDTKPEMVVRSLLHGMGYRFRLHVKSLPGKPDLVLVRHRVVIFVHGCFFHHHKGCSDAGIPKTNVKFWQDKLLGNAKRDRATQRRIRHLGWKPLIIWECEMRTPQRLVARVKKVLTPSSCRPCS